MQYAYITDQSDAVVYHCTINNSDGSFNTCSPLLAPPGWAPYAIAFATVNNVQYAYISDAGIGGALAIMVMCINAQ